MDEKDGEARAGRGLPKEHPNSECVCDGGVASGLIMFGQFWTERPRGCQLEALFRVSSDAHVIRVRTVFHTRAENPRYVPVETCEHCGQPGCFCDVDWEI